MASTNRTDKRRDRAVRTYVRRELHAHTSAAREQLGGPDFDRRRLRTVADLAAAAPVDLADAGDGARHLVQPTRGELLRSASPLMRARTAWASTWGSWPAFLRVIEPSYRPVHYFSAGGVAIGAAAKDLVRLAGMGAEWLRAAGVHTDDRVGLLEGAAGSIEPWQLSGGTRRAGVALAVVEAATDARLGKFSVIAGRPEAVADALRDGTWPDLRLALVFGRSADQVESCLARLRAAEQVAVRRAWVVPGARSVWYECAGGPDLGWHTNASAELVETADDDEALWTGLGWAGTVFLRLRTDLRVSRTDVTPCPSCGSTGPRLFLAAGSPALARWLRSDARVVEFRLTDTGADVLPARAGANARLVSEAAKAFPGTALTVKTKRAWQP